MSWRRLARGRQWLSRAVSSEAWRSPRSRNSWKCRRPRWYGTGARPKHGSRRSCESSMDAQRWDRVEELFHQAADLPRTDQQAFLDSACGGDESIRAEVAAMLEEDSRSASLLDRDLGHVADALLGAGTVLPWKEFGK